MGGEIAYRPPAERVPREIILRQVGLWASFGALKRFLDAMPHVVLILNSSRQIVMYNHALPGLMEREEHTGALGLRPGEVLDCVHACEHPKGCGHAEACRSCGAALAVLSAEDGRTDARLCQIQCGNSQKLELQISTTPVVQDGERFVVCTMENVRRESQQLSEQFRGAAEGLCRLARLMKDAEPDERERLAEMILRSAEKLLAKIEKG